MFIPELGEGWNPAIIETRRELDFIREAQRWFSDFRSFWIDGHTSFDHLEVISPCSLDNKGSGKITT